MKNSVTRWIMLFLLFGITTATAQTQYDLNNFNGLQSEGPVPADIQNSLRELYDMDKERVREYNQGKMTNRDRVLLGSYQINKLMASGRVLYGDPITKMVESVADKLLEDEPELRSHFRFYTVKSSDVNAFCTGQGMIFVNVGLIAQLQDESQLAYILSHEIVHYVRKHNLEVLTRDYRKDAKKSDEDDDIWESDRALRLFMKYHNRSHAMETEADTIGLVRFYLKWGYSTDLDGVFDVLQYSELPFDEIPFDTNYFNTDRYKVPHNCFLDSIKAISARDDYDDSKSSHPNIQKRRECTANILKRYPQGGKAYIVTTPEYFDYIRTLARFECIRMDLIGADYANAFYSCYMLQKTMPDNLYLEKSRLQAMYGIAKYKSYQSASSITPSHTDYEGEIQQIYHFFNKINANELNLLAVKELWKFKQQHPEEEEMGLLLENSCIDLFTRHKYTPDFFMHPGDSMQPVAIDTTQKHKNLKYERIRKKKQEEKITGNLNYIFYDLFETSSDFENYLKEIYIQKVKSSNITEVEPNHSNGIYLYSPTYRIYKQPDMELKVQKTEAHESQMPPMMEKVVEKTRFISHDFSDQAMQQSSDAQSYNEFARLNEWTIEFLNTKGAVPMRLYTQPQMDRLNDKYDAGLMNLVFVANIENYKNRYYLFPTTMALLSIAGTAPTIYNLTAHKEETYIRSFLIDTREAKLKKSSTTDVRLRDDDALVKSTLYQQLLEGLKDPKDKKAVTAGYLGKRLILNLGLNASFDYMHLINSQRALLPLQLNIGAEYVLPNNNGVAVSLQTRKTFTDYNYNVSNGSSFGINTRMDAFSTRISSLRAYYYIYKSDAPAPLGPFFRVGLNVSHYSLDTTGGYANLGVNNLHPNHMCVSVIGSFGRNYIFYDRIVLKIAVNYGITLASPFEPYIFRDTGFENPGDYKAKNFNHLHNARSWVSNLLGWEIGIGFLL